MLDIGCGEGYTSRQLSKAGAEVTGVDISDGLIEAALKEEERRTMGIEYIAADAADLSFLESSSFDLVTCYMAMMDVQDYERAISEASRVLKKGGKFVIVMEHPCFTTYRILNGETVSGWETCINEDGNKEYLYYWIKEYFRSHSYTSVWKHDRLPGSFKTTGFHRPLSDYANSLVKNGFVITGLDEPKPMEEGVRVHPPMSKHYKVPQSIVIEAMKIKDDELSC